MFAPDYEIEDNEGAGTTDEGTQDEQSDETEHPPVPGNAPPAKPGKYSPHNPKNMGAVVIDIFGSKERRTWHEILNKTFPF